MKTYGIMTNRVIISLTITLLIIFCFTHESYPDTDIPLEHWIYDALEDLALLGLTDIIGLNTRPISRLTAAYRVAAMIEDVQNDGLEFSILRDEKAMNKAEDLLYKLMDELEMELIKLDVEVVFREDKPPKPITHKLFEGLKLELLYGKLDDCNAKSVRLDNKRGWNLREGINGRASFRSWANWENILDVSVEPVFYGSKDKNSITLDEAFIEAAYKNVELGAGRTSLWWGPGHHGALLISNNTRPLYLAKIGNVNPFRIPYLEKLGLWNINFFTAKLFGEESRPVKEPYLSGLRVEFSPHKRLNLGATHTIMWGGEGAGHVSATDFLDMFLSKLGGGGDEPENHLISFTGEWAVPGLNALIPLASGALLYCEVGAEDEDGGLPSHIGGLGGVKIVDLFMAEDLSFVAEYAKTDSVWYTHYLYQDGYTSGGNMLGHHVGSDGDDFFVCLAKDLGEQFKLDLRFDFERHGLSRSVIEKRYQGGVGFEYKYLENLNICAGYEIRYYDGFNNVAKKTVKDHLISFGGKINF